ncbi:MAG: DNA cytosine methyltransferase [Candidatus Pacebacteria bacterium]|nr:DNA cytosine methyltransferase [Candidatus Paceibacterota bacterium]
MKVLVACEESQAVTTEFRMGGHEAYSCDLLPCSGLHPEWHIQGDVTKILAKDWDMILAFPPCTDLCSAGARHFASKRADGRQQSAIDFFMQFTDLTCPKVVIENPIGIMSNLYRKPDQIIQPWQFGHGESKATCLWLKGVPKLVPTCIVDGRVPRIYNMSPSNNRARLRSVTYVGIAKAMANQWGN